MPDTGALRPGSTIDRRPLTPYERDLINAAVNQPWSEELRAALAKRVRERGGYPDHAHCGDLVEWLESVGGKP